MLSKIPWAFGEGFLYFSDSNVCWGLPDSRRKSGNQAGSGHLGISALFPLSMLIPRVSGLVCQLVSMSKCSSPKLSGSFKIQCLAGKPVLQLYFLQWIIFQKLMDEAFFFFFFLSDLQCLLLQWKVSTKVALKLLCLCPHFCFKLFYCGCFIWLVIPLGIRALFWELLA